MEDQAASFEVYSHSRARPRRDGGEMPTVLPQGEVGEHVSTPSRATLASRRALRDASNFYHTSIAASFGIDVPGSVAHPLTGSQQPMRCASAASERARRQWRSDIFGHGHDDQKGGFTLRAHNGRIHNGGVRIE